MQFLNNEHYNLIACNVLWEHFCLKLSCCKNKLLYFEHTTNFCRGT